MKIIIVVVKSTRSIVANSEYIVKIIIVMVKPTRSILATLVIITPQLLNLLYQIIWLGPEDIILEIAMSLIIVSICSYMLIDDVEELSLPSSFTPF